MDIIRKGDEEIKNSGGIIIDIDDLFEYSNRL